MFVVCFNIISTQGPFFLLITRPVHLPSIKITHGFTDYREVDLISSSWTAFMMRGPIGRDNSNNYMVRQLLTHSWRIILLPCQTKLRPHHQCKWPQCLSSIHRYQPWCNLIPLDHRCSHNHWEWALRRTHFWILALGPSQWQTTGISNTIHSVALNFYRLHRKRASKCDFCDYIMCCACS
jgi:hypothetical protein